VTKSQQRFAAWLFAATSIVCFMVALIPVLKGGPPHIVLLGSGTVFLVIAIVIARMTGAGGNAPPVG
jgi:hypothetical protein